jgi:hypothetical protein
LVYQIIEGGKEIKAHGLREMPVWGNAFTKESSIYFSQHPPFNNESVIHSRILAITEYLYPKVSEFKNRFNILINI